jgi:hypothetical protein
MSVRCAIVIPVYRSIPQWNERISIQRCVDVFTDRDIIIVCPEGLDISAYTAIATKAIHLPLKSSYFKSIESYSLLLNSPYFYKHFLDYTYILIHQLDVFVFEDQLEYWCSKGYDYIGAPWINATWIKKLKEKISWIDTCIYPVGNGGFSLRKVKTFYYGSIFLAPIVLFLWKKKWNEDFFWSSVAHRLIPGFRIPQVEEARLFAIEEYPSIAYKSNHNKLPFGCHAWEKYEPDFWRVQIEALGYKW